MFLHAHKTVLIIVIAIICCIAITAYLLHTMHASQRLELALKRLHAAYPDHIKSVSQTGIIWSDNSFMPLGASHASQADKLNNPSLRDQLEQPDYTPGEPTTAPTTDPGRIRYEPFFRKMYGNSPAEVEKQLETMLWMPNIYGADEKIS